MVSTDIDFTGASINAPADVTAMIQSPSFSVPDPNDPSKELSSIKGWVTTEGNNANATGAQNYEFYVGKGDADIHQVLYALSKGYYRLVYNAFTEPEEQWKPPLHTATARMPGMRKSM